MHNFEPIIGRGGGGLESMVGLLGGGGGVGVSNSPHPFGCMDLAMC